MPTESDSRSQRELLNEQGRQAWSTLSEQLRNYSEVVSQPFTDVFNGQALARFSRDAESHYYNLLVTDLEDPRVVLMHMRFMWDHGGINTPLVADSSPSADDTYHRPSELELALAHSAFASYCESVEK